MRMSCNGCRVLRKGCSEDCIIRPCLHWIKNPDSQAHATLFLAKFYGRAGLINLINAGPDNLRPAIFRSLLYEACGRIVNPIYGSVGLLWSGSWQACQAAVDAVLNGKPIVAVNEDSHHHQLNPYDIRHVGAAADLHKVAKASRTRFKKSRQPEPKADADRLEDSRDSSENDDESFFSAEEASHVSQAEPSSREEEESGGALELDLTLGFEPAKPAAAVRAEPGRTRVEMMDGWDEDTCGIQLGLELRN